MKQYSKETINRLTAAIYAQRHAEGVKLIGELCAKMEESICTASLTLSNDFNDIKYLQGQVAAYRAIQAAILIPRKELPDARTRKTVTDAG